METIFESNLDLVVLEADDNSDDDDNSDNDLDTDKNDDNEDSEDTPSDDSNSDDDMNDDSEIQPPPPAPLIDEDGIKTESLYSDFIEMRNLLVTIHDNFINLQFRDSTDYNFVYSEIKKLINAVNKILNSKFEKNRYSEYLGVYNNFLSSLNLFKKLLNNARNTDTMNEDE